VKIYLDTSSLIKLYYKEVGTDHLDEILRNHPVEEIFLSEITITEFYSAIYKKVRNKDAFLKNANDILTSFNQDKPTYTFIPVDIEIIKISQLLIEKYGIKGLRSLDAIQFATIYNNRAIIDHVISADNLLNTFFTLEGIKLL
jgi:predicted nucleic acid-binding protein